MKALALFAATIAAISFGHWPAAAQIAVSPADGPRIAQAAPAPESSKAPKAQKARISWIVACPQDDKGKIPICTLKQELFLKSKGQRLLSVVVEKRRKRPRETIKLTLPLGIYMPAKVVLRVDKRKGPMKMEILTCDHGGCYADAPIKRNFMRKLTRGKQLTVTFETTKRQKITVPVPLSGFGKAFKAAKPK